jgi:hypothetical protein
MACMIESLGRWTWNAAKLAWGIALGWSRVAIFTGDGTHALFAIVLFVGVAAAASRNERNRPTAEAA